MGIIQQGSSYSDFRKWEVLIKNTEVAEDYRLYFLILL